MPVHLFANYTKFIHYSQQFQRFPDIDLPTQLFGEVEFKDLPIVHIRVSKNNTIVSLSDSKGKLMALNSCGKEGYKNCRKGTNIAGQATAITLGKVDSRPLLRLPNTMTAFHELANGHSHRIYIRFCLFIIYDF